MQQTIRALLLALCASVVLGGQGKPPVPPADYGQFETLAMVPNRGGLSPDGKWLAYGINRANRNNELRVVNVATGAVTVAAFGAQPSFGANSRWIAYSIGLSEAQQDKLRTDKKPIPGTSWDCWSWRAARPPSSTASSRSASTRTGSYLAMRHYAPEKKDAPPADGAAAEGDESPQGATLIVRDLATGRDTTFGNVAEFAWQDKGRLLAISISAEDKAGNGVQLFDPQGATLRVLDSSPSIYTALAWRKDSADLAVLKSWTDDRPRRSVARRVGVDASGRSSRGEARLQPLVGQRIPGRDADGGLSQTFLVRRRFARVSGRREMEREDRRTKADVDGVWRRQRSG